MTDLERELHELGVALAVPEPPDLSGAVRARIDGPAPRPTGPERLAWRRWLAVLVAAAVGIGLAASPQARATLADVLRFAGVEVHWGDPDPDAPAHAPLPGQQKVTSLEAARRAVDFAVEVPTELGAPDRIVVADSRRVVSLLYGSGRGQIRLDVFEGGLDPIFFKTIDQPVEYVDVGGAEGMWLAGPHLIRYVDRDGVVRSESARLSANTLIWEQDAVSHRLEGELSRNDAVAIAESLP